MYWWVPVSPSGAVVSIGCRRQSVQRASARSTILSGKWERSEQHASLSSSVRPTDRRRKKSAKLKTGWNPHARRSEQCRSHRRFGLVSGELGGLPCHPDRRLFEGAKARALVERHPRLGRPQVEN